jgi:GT2 family glycosyltransferase
MTGQAFSRPMLSISVVSHNQWILVEKLIGSLVACGITLSIELLITFNTPESIDESDIDTPFPVRILKNQRPLGFGENHNQAFRAAIGRCFAVVNPDIFFISNGWRTLLDALSLPGVGVVAPLVVSSIGIREDSARRFPTPRSIFSKVFLDRSPLDYSIDAPLTTVDWVGGMFMVFRREVYEQIGGFDVRYFLYYEDVDLCARLNLEGLKVLLCMDVKVIHDAQRHSHRNWRYMSWHLRSMWRFFTSGVYRQLRQQRRV